MASRRSSPNGTSGAPAGGDLAIVGGRVIVAPDRDPIDGATVLVRGGRVEQVGPQVEVPRGVPVLSAEGSAVCAGFWNAHVHFTEPKWAGALRAGPSEVSRHLTEMLLRRGFTTVVDTGSDPRITWPLRTATEQGTAAGPRILTAGMGIYPRRGLPYYIRGEIPFYLRWYIPQPGSPAAASRYVRQNLDRGADLVKLFTGSYVARGRVLPMEPEIARVAVQAAHTRHRLVFAHPSDRAGTEVAFDAGVDVLAHAPDSTEGIGPPFVRRWVERGMGMIPTLKMFGNTVTRDEGYLAPIYEIVREFRRAGGEILFGTDVGYMTDYSTKEEFDGLRTCGLDDREILRTLTVAPVRRFGLSATQGSIEPGKQADLTLIRLSDDRLDFSDVRATIRAGRPLWVAGS